MQDSSTHASSAVMSSRASSAQRGGNGTCTTTERRGVASANRFEVCELRSRCHELTALVTDALRENDVLRAQAERSAAALDAVSSDGSVVSRALRKHTDNVRRLHDDMRATKARDRSAGRKLKKKEATLDKVAQDVKKNRQLLDNDDRLPQEDELYERLATTVNSLTAKDSLIQELHDQIHQLTSLQSVALDKLKVQQKEKRSETERLFAHTDLLKQQIQISDRALAKGLIYIQKPARLARGGVGTEQVAPMWTQSLPKQESALTVQQRMKRFDTVRREQQIAEEQLRKTKAEQRKRNRERERQRKLEVVPEEKERERKGFQVEKAEVDKSREAQAQQRRLAAAMQRGVEERKRKLREERERIAREELERRKTRYRETVQQETESRQLKSHSRWYYEGSWRQDHQRSDEGGTDVGDATQVVLSIHQRPAAESDTDADTAVIINTNADRAQHND